MQLVKISRFAWTGASQNRWMTQIQWWIMLNACKLDCLQSAFSLCSYFNQRDCKLRRYVLGIGTRREKTDCGLQKPSFILGLACSNLSKKIIKRLLAVYPQVRNGQDDRRKTENFQRDRFWVDFVTVFVKLYFGILMRHVWSACVHWHFVELLFWTTIK